MVGWTFNNEFLLSFNNGYCRESTGHHSKSSIKKIRNKLFTNASAKNAIGKVDPKELQSQLTFIQQKYINIIQSLSRENIESKLEPTPMPSPIAKTKLEALDWNIKHTMYYCGQIGILKKF